MKHDQDNLRQRNEDLTQALREKTRKQNQTQALDDKLKRHSMLNQVQEAASDAVDHTVQASVVGNRFVDRVGNQPQNQSHRPPPPMFSDQTSNAMQRLALGGDRVANMGPPISQPRRGENAWAGFSSQGSNQRMRSNNSDVCMKV